MQRQKPRSISVHEQEVSHRRHRIAATQPRRNQALDVALLDHLLSTVPIGLGYVDMDFRYMRVSQALADFHGAPISSHVGRRVNELLGNELWSLLETYYRDASEGTAAFDIHLTVAHREVERNMLVSYQPVTDASKIVGVSVGARDITDYVNAERERLALIAQATGVTTRRHGILVEMLFALTNGKLRLADCPAELPESLEPISSPVKISADMLSTFRHAVLDAASRLGFDTDRSADFVLAVGEALDNVLVHAADGTAQVLSNAQSGVLQVIVHDAGPGIQESVLHRATLERGYSTAGSLGHGFYMILNTCDRISLLTGESGTTMVLEQDRNPTLPAWLLDR